MLGDEELMQAVGKGDLAALDEIVTRYQDAAWRTACRFLGNASEAQDIVQEAFLRIFEAARSYRPTGRFRAYFYLVVTRLCLDAARKKRPAATGDPPQSADLSPSPLEAMADRERDEAVHEAVERLPGRQRMAVVLRYFDGLACREVADAMGLSDKAVERLLARARTFLEEHLARELSSE